MNTPRTLCGTDVTYPYKFTSVSKSPTKNINVNQQIFLYTDRIEMLPEGRIIDYKYKAL